MNELNIFSYKKLYEQAENKAYKESKSTFADVKKQIEDKAYLHCLNIPCKKERDLYIIASIAYSWMPTMLQIFFPGNYNFKPLISNINKFKKGDKKVRVELVIELAKNCNHSIVGASKTLHIVNPKFAPIVDRRVSEKWNKFFRHLIYRNEIVRLPSSWNFSSKNSKELRNKVSKYIEYWDNILEWKRNMKSKYSVKDIEVLFYYLGGKNYS